MASLDLFVHLLQFLIYPHIVMDSISQTNIIICFYYLVPGKRRSVIQLTGDSTRERQTVKTQTMLRNNRNRSGQQHQENVCVRDKQ